jgi:hypothetical protein
MNPGEKKNLLSDLRGFVGLVAVFAVVLAVVGIIASIVQDITSIPPGSNCSLVRMAYGTRDLGDSYTALEKAKSVKDEFGIAELEKREAVAEISEGTQCLVLDSDFFTQFTPYRKIRILSIAHIGKAFWIKRDDLKK